jgi:hypothetical protein
MFKNILAKIKNLSIKVWICTKQFLLELRYIWDEYFFRHSLYKLKIASKSKDFLVLKTKFANLSDFHKMFSTFMISLACCCCFLISYNLDDTEGIYIKYLKPGIHSIFEPFFNLLTNATTYTTFSLYSLFSCLIIVIYHILKFFNASKKTKVRYIALSCLVFGIYTILKFFFYTSNKTEVIYILFCFFIVVIYRILKPFFNLSKETRVTNRVFLVTFAILFIFNLCFLELFFNLSDHTKGTYILVAVLILVLEQALEIFWGLVPLSEFELYMLNEPKNDPLCRFFRSCFNIIKSFIYFLRLFLYFLWLLLVKLWRYVTSNFFVTFTCVALVSGGINVTIIILYEGVSYWEIEFWRDEVSWFCSYMVLLLLSFVFSVTLVFYYQKQIGQKLSIFSKQAAYKILQLTGLFFLVLHGLLWIYAYDQANKQKEIYENFTDAICKMELTATEPESIKSKDLCNIFKYLNDQKTKYAKIPYSIAGVSVNIFLMIFTMFIMSSYSRSPNKVRPNQTRTHRKSRWRRYRRGVRRLKDKK